MGEVCFSRKNNKISSTVLPSITLLLTRQLLVAFKAYFRCTTWYILTHLFPMHPFSAVWNHLKTSLFSNVFSGYRKSALGANGLLDTFLTTHRYADTKNTYNVYVITHTQRILVYIQNARISKRRICWHKKLKKHKNYKDKMKIKSRSKLRILNKLFKF